MRKSGAVWKSRIGNSRLYRDGMKIKNRIFWQFASRSAGKCLAMTEQEADEILRRLHPKRNESRRCPRSCYGQWEVVLTVIIPAYNVQEYIGKCLDSVLEQELEISYEIVVVNDGSTDGTEKILRKYEGMDNVCVIHQENQGLSGARNRGLELARGKYIFFLDSDDYLLPGCLKNMVETAESCGADIVQGKYQYLREGHLIPVWIRGPYGRIREYGEMCRLPGFASMKLYRSQLFSDVFFPEGYWFEDSIVQLILFERCRKLVMLRETGYVYRVNAGGISQTYKNSPRCLDALWVIGSILDMRRTLGMKMTPEVYRVILEHLSVLLYRRIDVMDEMVIRAAFIKACGYVKELGIEWKEECLLGGIPLESRMGCLHRAFREKNYGMWLICCKYG